MESKITVLSPDELQALILQAIEQAQEGQQPDLPKWPDHLTTSQAAKILNITEDTFRKYPSRYDIRSRESGAAKWLTEDVLRVWRDKRDLVI